MNPFSSINENNRPLGLFEPHTPNLTPKLEHEHNFKFYPPTNPKKSMKQSNHIFKPDWNPDFDEYIDIEANSISLALSVLGVSKSEYNTMDINQLKSLKRIDTFGSNNDAINILIYYKQNSKNLSFPQINPIIHSPIKPKFNQYGNGDEKAYAKIHPEIN